MKAKPKLPSDELRPEYDLDYSQAVRGKYHKQLLKKGANVIALDPDIAEAFGDSVSVNEALRSLLELTHTTQRLVKSRFPAGEGIKEKPARGTSGKSEGQ